MLSRIQDLSRYQSDLKRFKLGIDSVSGEAKEVGQNILNNLNEAVCTFDTCTIGLLLQKEQSGHLDHANAQELVRKLKDEMETWMIHNAPNIHVDEIIDQNALKIDSDK